MADLDLTAITRARRAVRVAADSLRATEVRIAEAGRARERALSRGDGDAARTAEQELEQLRQARATATGALDDARREVTGRAGELAAAGTPEEAAASLDGAVPILMLPVRLEARFADDRTSLRVRILPDQAHVTAHEDALTEAEVEGLRWYWQHRWADRVTSDRPGGTATADALADEAWSVLAGRFRPGRAAYLVRHHPPSNLEGDGPRPRWGALPRRDTTVLAPPRAELLPQRWCVLGFRRTAEGSHRELFRVWGEPVPDTLAAGPTPDPEEPEEQDEPGGLPTDPGLAWLHDPDAAAAAGMLVTVVDGDLPDGETLAAGVDRLLAVGVDWTLDPDAAAAAVGAHLEAHAGEGRLAFVEQGTPTNSTGAGRSGFTSDPSAARDATAPHRDVPAADGAAAPVLASALGLAPGPGLAHAPGSDAREQAWQRALVTALWPATGGYYLTEMLDPLCDDPRIEAAVRVHAVAHLRASGPLPTLRIGHQPYGVLPVIPREHAATPASEHVHRVAARLRGLVEPLVEQVPRLGVLGDAGDVDDVLLDLLRRTPVAWSLTFRQLIGPVQRKAVAGRFWEMIAAFQRDVTATVFAQLGARTPTLLSELTHDDRDHALSVPWVLRPEPTDADPEARGTGYLDELLELLEEPGGRALLDGRENAVALLEAFLACSAVRELDAAAKRTAERGAGPANLSDEFLQIVRRPADRVPYALRIEEAVVAPAAPGSVTGVPRTPLELATTIIPGITGAATLAEHVTTGFRRARTQRPESLADPDEPLHRLAEFADAVRTLRDAPAHQLEWAMRGALDLFATRLDAWTTSLATARLSALRERRPAGVHVGGWGVLEELRPAGPSDGQDGFLAAPSVDRATALALLRSARLSHRGGDGATFDLDLTSARVREALHVLEGVNAGQRLGALLGYRVERALQAADPRLAAYILPLRRQCPLRSDRPDDPDVSVPVEAVAARNVVDGVALLDRFAADGAALLVAAGVAVADRDAVSDVITAVAGIADAVSDVLVAESVHQAASGNLDRSGAALAAHDRQAPAPDPEFVRTPRDGATHAHRVGIWLPAGRIDPAPGWAADLRSTAEPRLDRWLGLVLGDPADRPVRARLHRAGGDAQDLPELSVGRLGISALSVVLAARRPGGDRPSELELLLALAAGPAAAGAGLAPGPDDQVELDAASLAPWLDLAAWAGDVVGAGPLDPAHLSSTADLSPSASSAATTDVAEVLGRLRLVRAEAVARVRALRQALSTRGGPDPDVLLAALAGVAPLDGPDALLPAEGVDAVAHARAVLERVQARTAAADVLGDAPAEAAPDGLDPRVAKARAVVAALLGPDQPFLPVSVPTDPAPLSAALAARDQLLAGDPSAPVVWLHRSALVRPALEPLAALLENAEAGGADVGGATAVIQLPHRPGDRWVALPYGDDGPPPEGTIGVVLHAPDGVDPAAGGAGVVVDTWSETVPDADHVAAVTFRFDAPGARAPQSMLLAVHPDREPGTWTFPMIVDSVQEAVDLARLRTVGSRELAGLSTVLPALFLPDGYSRDVPGIRIRELVRNAEATKVGGLVGAHTLGKAVPRGRT